MAVKNAKALKAARDFVRAVQESGVHLQAAYLFGSYAKGTARARSDIDVALISKNFSGWVDDLQLIKPALISMDMRIEHVRFNPRSFVDENPLAWEIKTTGIPLIGNGKRKRTAHKPIKRR
jgi:predicted nucleotidyltransferase